MIVLRAFALREFALRGAGECLIGLTLLQTPMDTEQEMILTRVRELAREQVGLSTDEPLSPRTRLVQDLGIFGDDGDELMDCYRKEFHVDLTGFDIEEHFGREGVRWWQPPVTFLLIPFYLARCAYRRLSGQGPREFGSQYPEITLADLVDWAIRGRWTPKGEESPPGSL